MPHTCTLQTKTHTFTNALQYKGKSGTLCNFMQPHYGKANIYANVVESYVMNPSVRKDAKTNWERLKDVILKVQYQHFSTHAGGH